MTREKLLQIAKPILFNTEMVRAILDGRKGCTRRVVKPHPDDRHSYPLGYVTDSTDKKTVGYFGFGIDEYGGSIQYANPPYKYKPGDILYVRETWCNDKYRYMYRANYEDNEKFYRGGAEVNVKWKPSIHMPKGAARIFLKVKDVRVERLQEITEEEAYSEGTDPWDDACYSHNGWHPTLADPDSGGPCDIVSGFQELWNSTIKKAELEQYGWDANPWVWVIEFERIEV